MSHITPRRWSVLALALVACLTLAATDARADGTVIVRYDFRDPGANPLFGNQSPSFTFPFPDEVVGPFITPPGSLTPAQIPSITVTSLIFDVPSPVIFGQPRPITVNSSAVTQTPFGLGVTWSGSIGNLPFIGSLPISDLDANEVDGQGLNITLPFIGNINIDGPNEGLDFTFGNFVAAPNAEVLFAGFTLTNESGTNNEDADVFLNNVFIGTFALPSAVGTPAFVPLPGAPIVVTPGTVLSLRVSGDNDDWSIASLILRITIPEPATTTLLCIGVGAALLRRRRRKTA